MPSRRNCLEPARSAGESDLGLEVGEARKRSRRVSERPAANWSSPPRQLLRFVGAVVVIRIRAHRARATAVLQMSEDERAPVRELGQGLLNPTQVVQGATDREPQACTYFRRR